MAAQDIADRLIRDLMPQIGQRAHDPVIAPGPVLLGHADNQLFDFSVNPRPARGSTLLRAIELASDEPSVPSQDGIRQGGSRHLAERLAAQPMANFAPLRSAASESSSRPFNWPLRIRFSAARYSFRSSSSWSTVSVMKARMRAHSISSLPFARRSAMGTIDQPQKRSGRHAARLRRHRINSRLSYSSNFLTVRSRSA